MLQYQKIICRDKNVMAESGRGLQYCQLFLIQDIIIIIIIIIIVVVVVVEVTHSKTILEITVEIEPQPAALDLKNFSQYSSRLK